MKTTKKLPLNLTFVSKLYTVFALFTATLALLNATPVFADVQQAVFASAVQTIAVKAISEKITVQTQDFAGTETKVPSTACISLSSSSGSGEFSSSVTNWSAVSVLTMNKNSANRNFYYKEATAGTHTLTGKVVLKPESEMRSCTNWPTTEWPTGWTVSQAITVGSSSGSAASSASGTPQSAADSPPPAEQPAPTKASSSGSTWVFVPQIYVNALVPIKAVAGAPVGFDAVAVGTKKEPLENARYIWSFGDGGTAEGKKVQHVYHYPATYVVMVTSASGEWNATDRKEILVAAPELVISSLREGEDGFIEIRNNGKDEVNLSEWLLLSGSTMFRIPQGTLIGAKQSIPFPTAITKVFADPYSTALLYPNGKAVASYTALPAEPAPATVSRVVAPPAAQSEASPKTTVVPVAKRQSEPEKAEAPSEELLLAAGAAASPIDEEKNGMFPWVWGVAALVSVAAIGYVSMLRKPEPTPAEVLRKEAASFDIIE